MPPQRPVGGMTRDLAGSNNVDFTIDFSGFVHQAQIEVDDSIVKTDGCLCDVGFHGVDCSIVECPTSSAIKKPSLAKTARRNPRPVSLQRRLPLVISAVAVVLVTPLPASANASAVSQVPLVKRLLIFSKYKNSNFSEILREMKDLREIFRNIFII